MPNAHENGATISHNWDDDSSSEYKIKLIIDDETGAKVYLSSAGDSLIIYPESWELIRDKINSFFSTEEN